MPLQTDETQPSITGEKHPTLAELKQVRDLIAVSLKLLVAMGAVALAVLAPSPASAVAAVVALGDAVDTIVGAEP